MERALDSDINPVTSGRKPGGSCPQLWLRVPIHPPTWERKSLLSSMSHGAADSSWTISGNQGLTERWRARGVRKRSNQRCDILKQTPEKTCSRTVKYALLVTTDRHGEKHHSQLPSCQHHCKLLFSASLSCSASSCSQ